MVSERKKSTVDHLIKLGTHIRNANMRKDHLIAIFFDLERTYDTPWKYGDMKDLHKIRLRKQFLSERNFKVRIGSRPQKLEEVVPQGIILSVTLFSIKINDIVNCLKSGAEGSLYVGDFLIYYRLKFIHTIER